MTNLNAALDALAPEPAVRTLVEQVAAQRSVAPERMADYISLRPGGGGPIAAFVHRTYVDVAQPPAVAAGKAAGVPGATLDEKTPATTYVRVPLASVHLSGVLTMVKEALAWRSSMPDTAGRDRSQQVPVHASACSVCNLVHAGEC
jgi:hypothetical protein